MMRHSTKPPNAEEAARIVAAKEGKKMTSKTRQFSWDKVKVGDPSECWPWTGYINTWGYGDASFMGKRVNASRAAYLSTHGEIATGLVVCHSCDNPACCNPSHLRADTQANNLAECREKGRQTYKTGASHHRCKAKLTEADVRDVRARYAQGQRQEDIGAMYGIYGATVSRIVNRKSWSHVE